MGSLEGVHGDVVPAIGLQYDILTNSKAKLPFLRSHDGFHQLQGNGAGPTGTKWRHHPQWTTMAGHRAQQNRHWVDDLL